MAFSLKTTDGKLDYHILKRRLKRVALPICLVLFFGCIYFLSLVTPDKLDYAAAILWGATLSTMGIYCSLFFSAKFVNTSGSLTRGAWLGMTMLCAAAIAVFCWFVFGYVLMPLGDYFNSG